MKESDAPKRLKNVNIRVTEEDFERFHRLARARDLSISVFLRQLLRELDGLAPRIAASKTVSP